MVVSLLALLASLTFAGAIAINMHRQFSDTLRKIAGMNGDLTQRLATPGKDELSSLNRAYNTMLESIQHIVQEIKQGAVVCPMPAAVLRWEIRIWLNVQMNRLHQ